jgi:hypothetical protein
VRAPQWLSSAYVLGLERELALRLNSENNEAQIGEVPRIPYFFDKKKYTEVIVFRA